MLLGDDVVGDRQAEAGALAGGLGGKEWLEQFIPDVGRNTGAVVPHTNFHHLARIACRDLQHRREPSVSAITRSPRGRVEPVAEDVQEHPCHVLRIDLNWGDAFAEVAFDDYRKMVSSPEIDAVAVVVRVPSHYAPTKAALEAGKHVYCEWPLGRTTSEAAELSALAKSNRLVTAVGLQARVNPALMHMKEQVESGFVGEVLSVHVSLLRDGVLSRPSHRTWQREVELGANTLTIAAGHTVDAMRFVTGDFTRLSSVVATQAKQWLDTGTGKPVDVTSPDNVLLNGTLVNGAVASVHIGSIPFAGSGYRMEIYGREGTLVATGEDLPQLGRVLLYGAKLDNKLTPLPVPERFVMAAPSTHGTQQCRSDVCAVRSSNP